MSQSALPIPPLFYTSPEDVRALCRSNTAGTVTAGMAAGFIQANLVILPKAYAEDFAKFCRLNPKPCPIVGISQPGEYDTPALGRNLDIRTDLPLYRVWRDGILTDEVTDILPLWQDDFVVFALGCSFSFENAFMACNVPMRHFETGLGVSMYRTNIVCTPVGPFSGPVVVSMRPFRSSDLIKATEISSRIPLAHGGPVQIGFPEEIGITDIDKPDYGARTDIRSHELPAFWACGVTPQAVLAESRLPFAITHAPGAMLVTDIPIPDYENLVSEHSGKII